MSEITTMIYLFFTWNGRCYQTAKSCFIKIHEVQSCDYEMNMGLTPLFFSEQHEFSNALRTQRGKIKCGCIT